MNVEAILADKGRDTVTVSAGQTLAEVVAVLHGRRIGAVVVVDGDGGVDGILSERDVVRAVAERGPDALGETVGACMTSRVVTCTPTDTVQTLMGMMTERKFRHVPVVVGGRLAGMVSIGDCVKHRLAEMEAEHSAMREYITTG